MAPMPCTETSNFDADGLALLAELAAQSICQAVLGQPSDHAAPYPAHFDLPGASFVTLHQAGRLRGCIGTLTAYRALREDVTANALAAALRDPRFAPLSARELKVTDVDVSVLSAPSALRFSDEADFFRQLRPCVDGLIVEYCGRRATYLPSVWQQLPDAPQFVRELRRKAGIDDALPLTALSVQRYVTQHSTPRVLTPG